MRCTFCGTDLSPDARFCGNCGNLVESMSPANEATSRSNVSGINDMVLEEQRRQQTPVIYAQPATSYPPFSPTPTPPPPPQYDRYDQQEKRRALSPVAKVAIIVACIVVVLGAVSVGLLLYFLNLPQPVISLSSSYHVNRTPAGATGTTLHISGQKFSSSSTITFLLDNSPLPSNDSVQSDSSGNVSANLTITSDWSTGRHTITARDASNYITKSGVAVIIVPQGEANTPGPNGAPPDDASFKVNAAINTTLEGANQPFNTTETLIVTGQPDPNGGTVCQAGDNGQPRTTRQATVDTGQGYNETSAYSCSGTYKAGKLTYTETTTSDVITFNSGGTCTLTSPQISEQLSGSYTGNNTFSGTVTYLKLSSYNCSNPGSYFFHYGAQGNWTGQVTNS
jgi:hypothetical protein